MLLTTLFWFGFGLLFYHIFVYGPLLWCININKWKPPKPGKASSDIDLPTITVVCAAYNEEAHIEKKIKSFLDLDYPADKINMIVISDSSTDKTDAIVSRYLDRNIHLVRQNPRGGKQRAQNLIEPSITTDYVLSTDANAIFAPDAIRILVKSITQSSDIGIISGKVRLVKTDQQDSGEGLYWRYECFLKSVDSDFASIIGSNGAIFLIRRDLFKQIHPNSCDDFERTLNVLKAGYKAVYQPQAKVYEEVTQRPSQELKRKIRIITTEWYAIQRNSILLDPFRFAKISFIIFSHKLIRWLFFLCMILMLVSSGLIPHPFYRWLFGLQVLFYALGALELMLEKYNKFIPGLSLVAYITAMGWASLVAFYKFIFKADMGVWDPVRQKVSK